MFKSITDVLFKTNNFKITILMFIKNNNDNNSKFKKNEIIKIHKKNPNELPSLYLDTFNRSAIGFSTILPNATEGITSNGENIFFSQKYFYEIDAALSICLEWLKSKHYRYLFDISNDGIVKGLGNPPPYYPAIYKNQNDYIRFYPTVVRDINNVLTEGIGIRSNKNALAQFTCIEFFNLALSVKNYISNSYNNNLQLLNFGINLISKFKQ